MLQLGLSTLLICSVAVSVCPGGLNGDPKGYPIGKGADIFISVWNLHHSPYLWKDPEAFNPQRFSGAVAWRTTRVILHSHMTPTIVVAQYHDIRAKLSVLGV